MNSEPPPRFGPLARALHALDFGVLLPWLGRLPQPLGERISAWRARLRGRWQADWRSLALGRSHIGPRTDEALRELAPDADDAQRLAWRRERYAAEARDELESRWVAEGRCSDLQARFLPPGAAASLQRQNRGLVLLTAHHHSFILGIVFLARCGLRVNAMKSTVTHDARVVRSVSAHFDAKYAGLQRHLNGGILVDIEAGVRPIYRMLERGEVVVVLADAPVLPNGTWMDVTFLGARRTLAGGAVRIAQKTSADLGAFVCRRSGPQRYTVGISAIGPASEASVIDAAYGFLSDAILGDPGGWWAADLLPAMPRSAAAAVATSMAAAFPSSDVALASLSASSAAPALSPLDVLLLTDSPLESSAELAYGRLQLRRRLQSDGGVRHWHETRAAQIGGPAAWLRDYGNDGGSDSRWLLVLCHPALLVPPGLMRALVQALDGSLATPSTQGQPICAVAASQNAPGPNPPRYTTQSDFDAYASSRAELPAAASPGGPASVYLLDRAGVAAALASLQLARDIPWPELPEALGVLTVTAPRAYVHDYADYRGHERADLLALLPADAHRIVDVGGGEGAFAAAFVRERGGRAWVLEPDAAAAARARARGLPVIEGRLGSADAAHDGSFDAVTMLDMLEHLEDPLQALCDARRLLRPGGALLVATPNVGHASIAAALLGGRFDYTPVGSLCWTHLRFFTAATLNELLREAGFRIEQEYSAPAEPAAPPPAWALAARNAGLAVDLASLGTETLKVLARAD